MKVIDPGHTYLLDSLDGGIGQLITFVKRVGEGYPGNLDAHPGPIIQEYLRAIIDRVKFLETQESDANNRYVIHHLEEAMYFLELRAAQRNDSIRHNPMMYSMSSSGISEKPVCSHCGHISCRFMV